MNRITKEQQEEIKKYEMNSIQTAIYRSLLQAQERYPKLSKKQYNLFKIIYSQVQKNKKSINYG